MIPDLNLPQMFAYRDASPSGSSSGNSIPDLNLPQMSAYSGASPSGGSSGGPIPDLNLPQMSTYSGASPSGSSSGVPQPIDFGGRASGHSGVSQSQHSSVQQIKYGGVSQSGGTSRAPQRLCRRYPDEVKSRVLREIREEMASGKTMKSYAERSRIPYDTLKTWHRSITTQSRQSYAGEVKSRALSEIKEEMARGKTIKSYAERSTIPYETLKKWHKSITTRSRRSYAAEEKSRTVIELKRELGNKTSTIASYADKTGIPLRTLARWLNDKDTSRGT